MINSTITKKKKLGDILKGLTGVGAGITGLTKRVATEGITRGEETLVPPTTPGAGLDIGAEIKPKRDPRDELIDRLTKALGAAEKAPSLVEEYKAEKVERGIPAMKEKIGTFDEEIGKARDLLSDLDARIRGGVAAETARTIPMPLITGRSAALKEQAGIERGDIISALESLQRGREGATGAYERELGEARDILGLKREERAGALGRLGTEIGLRGDILGLTAPAEREISEITDEEGNRIVTLYNEKTGETREINVGKVAPDVTTQIIEAGGRTLLINAQTGETIKDLGAAPPTGEQKETQQLANIESRLRASAGTDGFVDPGVFMDERRKSKMGPSEFDKRFGSLLSPQERERLGIEETGPGAVAEKFIDKEYIKEKLGDRIKGIAADVVDWPTFKKKSTEVNEVISILMKEVENWRIAGYPDNDIWEVILKKVEEYETK